MIATNAPQGRHDVTLPGDLDEHCGTARAGGGSDFKDLSAGTLSDIPHKKPWCNPYEVLYSVLSIHSLGQSWVAVPSELQAVTTDLDPGVFDNLHMNRVSWLTFMYCPLVFSFGQTATAVLGIWRTNNGHENKAPPIPPR